MDTTEAPRANARLLPVSLRELNPLVVDDLIRCGDERDGGYVVPASSITAIDALVSFGLGHNWSFEEHAVWLNPCLIVHVYDHSVTERAYLDRFLAAWHRVRTGRGAMGELHWMVSFYESYRDFFSGGALHFQQKIVDRVVQADDITVGQALARVADKRRLLLKMDIEGDEYRVIEALLAHHARILTMVVEFHDTAALRDLFLAKVALIRQRYEIVHIHGNNLSGVATDGLPEVLEITFLHKTLCAAAPRRNRLPIAHLDYPNDPRKSDHELVFA